MNTAQSFRCAIYGVGETRPSYNALVFATAYEADTYGRNLASRWMGMSRFEVETVDMAVTHEIHTPYTLVTV